MEKYLYSDLFELEDNHWWHKAKRETSLYLINKFIKLKDNKILDVGCGAGKNMESMAKFGEVWGIDINEESIKYCRFRGLQKIKIASSEKTGFKVNFFDLVTLFDVLEHTDEDKTLKEMKRVLKKGGLILLAVPAYPWLWSKWDEVLHHKRRYTQKSLAGVLEKNSFKILEISYMHPHLVILVFIIRFIRSKLIHRKQYNSDFKINNPIFNFLLYSLAKFQLKLMQITSIPFGISLICIARLEK